jgi:hypothetical protein
MYYLLIVFPGSGTQHPLAFYIHNTRALPTHPSLREPNGQEYEQEQPLGN